MRWFALLLLALPLSFSAACDDEEAAPAASAASGPDATYTVRGRLAEVTGDQISVQHEAIPDFRNQAGEEVGMVTMTMAFHLGEGASTAGISAGDPVEMTFDVDWGGDHPMTIREIRGLPADTALQL